MDSCEQAVSAGWGASIWYFQLRVSNRATACVELVKQFRKLALCLELDFHIPAPGEEVAISAGTIAFG